MIDTSVCHVYFMLSVSEFVLNFFGYVYLAFVPSETVGWN